MGKEYLLIDGVVKFCYTLMSPVFTQLWKDLPQSIRPEKAEIGKAIRNQIYEAEHFPFGCQLPINTG
jgi:hypothetical protein